MSNAFLIELGGLTVGIVAREPGERAYHFYAVNRSARPLEGRTFPTPGAAEKAARAALAAARGAAAARGVKASVVGHAPSL